MKNFTSAAKSRSRFGSRDQVSVLGPYFFVSGALGRVFLKGAGSDSGPAARVWPIAFTCVNQNCEGGSILRVAFLLSSILLQCCVFGYCTDSRVRAWQGGFQ